MAITTTYSSARANFARLIRQAVEDRETLCITRRGGEDVVLIARSELEGILETAHLLRSPANAERLLAAIAAARAQIGKAQTVADLKREVGLE
ncbi:MAG TPA: type II toxin-antitoxin system prevent-host-death family antitoxin [Blastocatellia bacterium]|nr:type II toxin-antitoxin system prevent-host-death family antitoxin [Blastocatellia bacterium]